MIKTITKCSKCGVEVDRVNSSPFAVCFNCKKARVSRRNKKLRP